MNKAVMFVLTLLTAISLGSVGFTVTQVVVSPVSSLAEGPSPIGFTWG